MLKSKPKARKKNTNPIFKFLDAITYTKEDLNFDDPQISKDYEPYMINRWLSMVEIYLVFVNDTVNRYEMDKVSHFQFLKSSLPKQKVVRWDYIKKKKDLNIQEKKYIADYFEIGLKEAELYINMMEPKIIEKFLSIYTYGRNKTVDI